MLCYLAMTAAETKFCQDLPSPMAWMACHYAPYGTGLSNIPSHLPQGAMLMINDRTLPNGHDPEYILWQLRKLHEQSPIGKILLDLQHPDNPENAALAALLTEKADIPTAVTQWYASGLDCPVFLSAPLHQPLEETLAPWNGRQIWMECAVCRELIQVTTQGTTFHDLLDLEEEKTDFLAEELFCRYRIETAKDHISFHLYRSKDLIPAFLAHGEKLGVCLAVGLYQQLGN